MADISIKDFIAETDENGNVITNVNESKPKTKNYASYEVVENSGIDIIIKRTLGKDVQYMAIIASQGQYYIKKEKTGEIFRVDDTKYRTFWSGLKNSDDVFVIPTTSEYDVYDKFRLTNQWAERLAYAIKDESFVNLAKAGLITLSQYVNMEYPEWMGGRYRASEHPITKDMTKIIKYCITKLMESGKSKSDAIASIYGCNGDVKMNDRAVMGFINLSWVYSWEVAFKAIDEYMNNDLLSGFTASGLVNILTCIRDGTRPVNGGYYYRSSADSWRTKDDVDQARNYGRIVTFEANRLIEYMFNEALECGSGDNIHEWCGQWADALANQYYVYGKLVEKYPPNLPLYHDKIAYRYRINKKFYDLVRWKKAAERCAVYETTWKEWILKAPKTTDDILDEAQQMSNCVASYVQRVIDGETNILFLRKKDEPDVSVCTVEIRNEAVVQFKARRNATPTNEQRDALLALIKKNRRARELPVDSTVLEREYFRV